MEKKTRIFAILALFALTFMSASMQAAQTAQQKLNTAVSKYLKSSVTATFSYSGALGKGKGTLKTSGSKFVLETTGGSCWYNGQYMWTYSGHTSETTLTKPSKQELAESNPLSVVAASASQYNASYAPKQTKGTSTIVLTPKSKSFGYKRVVVVLDEKSCKPMKIDVTGSDGSRTVLSINSLSTGQKHSASIFSYPKNNYPKAKIVDLR